MPHYEDYSFESNRPEVHTPEYKAWRWAVLKRDNFTCQLTKSTEDLVVHHIKPWARYPQLRYVVSNGITVTRERHDEITGHEKEWEDILYNLIREIYPGNQKNQKKNKYRKEKDWNLRW